MSSQDAKGFLDMLIKVRLHSSHPSALERLLIASRVCVQVYFRTPQFPEGGKMTLGFEELQIGDKVEFKGPLGSFRWVGDGVCNWRGVERKVRKIGMVCGGSGEYPMFIEVWCVSELLC